MITSFSSSSLGAILFSSIRFIPPLFTPECSFLKPSLQTLIVHNIETQSCMSIPRFGPPGFSRGGMRVIRGRRFILCSRDSPANCACRIQFHLRFKFRFTHFQRMSLIRPASFSRRCPLGYQLYF